MHRAPVRCLLLTALILLPAHPAGADATKAETRRTEEKELYDDGSLHFRVPLNAKGERHGLYIAFYRGGKKIQQKVQYERGERVGARQLYDEKGQLIGEEFWVHGKLVNPKSIKLIEAERARLLKEATALVSKMPTLTNPRAPKPEILAEALTKLNTARYLADLPDDVTLDDHYIDVCQYASELLATLGHLTHTPEKPRGYDDNAYALGKEGCGHSNIYEGGDAVRSIDGYLNDSDPSNIDRIGHRRWILNPAMAKTGFGGSGGFSAMYSMDRSRQSPVDYDFVCYPPRGSCPLNLFEPSSAWHVSVNPRKYAVSDDAALEIFPVDSRLLRAPQPLALNYSHVDRGPFGIGNAVIARPDRSAIKPGVVYEVVVHGVTAKDASAAELSYYVNFYNSAPMP